MDQAILAEEERAVVIRFGHDWDETCMQVNSSLPDLFSFPFPRSLPFSLSLSLAMASHFVSYASFIENKSLLSSFHSLGVFDVFENSICLLWRASFCLR